MQNCELIIDLDAIRKNIQEISSALPLGGMIMPMIKANGYGTDAFQMTKFFQDEGVPFAGVSHVMEGVSLREKGIKMPLFAISAPPFEADLVVRHDLEVAVSNKVEVLALQEKGELYRKIVNVHLQVDTGLNRFGCRPEETEAMLTLIARLPNINLSGIMTHFQGAEWKGHDALTKRQISLFESVAQKCDPRPKWVHIANSSGALRWEIPFCNLVRIGLSLYGYNPLSVGNEHIALTPALELKTRIASIRECKEGETVGYGTDSPIKKERAVIAILPVGYHDGLHGHYSEKGYVLIHNKKASMIGKIYMDFMTVDVSEIPEAQIGDEVEIFGKNLPPEKIAAWGNTNIRQLLSCLGPRIKRAFRQTPRLFTKDLLKEKLPIQK